MFTMLACSRTCRLSLGAGNRRYSRWRFAPQNMESSQTASRSATPFRGATSCGYAHGPDDPSGSLEDPSGYVRKHADSDSRCQAKPGNHRSQYPSPFTWTKFAETIKTDLALL
jgi:hypothetical protein